MNLEVQKKWASIKCSKANKIFWNVILLGIGIKNKYWYEPCYSYFQYYSTIPIFFENLKF